MPRPKTHSRESLTQAAMRIFWSNGYEATSLGQLTQETGVNRQGIYGEFTGKHDLFLAALEQYQTEVVTPAFSQVEESNADIDAIAAYFNQQIDLAETMGLPGPGCLIANTMTEVAPHNEAVSTSVNAHNTRLQKGFENALNTECNKHSPSKSNTDIQSMAMMSVVFAQGLWSTSRSTASAEPLRASINQYLDLIQLWRDCK